MNTLKKNIIIMLLSISSTFAQDPVLKKSAVVAANSPYPYPASATTNYAQVFISKTDKDDNKYLSGRYKGTVDFEPGSGVVNYTSTNTGGSAGFDLFIAKLDKNDNLIWAKTIGSTGDNEQVLNLAVDVNQNVIVAGQFREDMDFDPGPGTFMMSNGSVASDFKSLFMLKLEANGEFLWAKNFQANTTKMAFTVSDMYADAQNNIQLLGSFSGTVDFDPNVGSVVVSSSSSDFDSFFLKLTSSGNYVFHKKYGGTFFLDNINYSISTSSGRGSVTDANGDIYFLWSFKNNSFGTPRGYTMVTKYNATGTQLWEYNTYGTYLNTPNYLKIVADKIGGVFIAADDQVIKINASTGLEAWTKLLRGSTILIDKNNNIIRTGNLPNSFGFQYDFDPSTAGVFLLGAIGTQDISILKTDNNGFFLYAKVLGAVGSYCFTQGASINANKELRVQGQFSTTIDVDPSAGTKILTNSSGNQYQPFWATYSDVPCTGSANSSSVSVIACNSYRWASKAVIYTTTGIYKDTLTNVAGCDSIITLNLTVNPFSGITTTSVSGYTLSCNISSITVTAGGLSGAYTWTGSNGYTANTAAATFTVAGRYWVTGTATGGCIVSKSVDIFEDKVKPTLSASPTAATIFCATPTASIQLFGNSTVFSWTGPNGFTANTPFANLGTGGVFTITGSGANGCTTTASVTITDSRVLIPITVTPATAIRNCNNNSPTVTASGATTYLWTRSSDGFTATTPSITISNLDTYTVTGNSASGCGSVIVPVINDFVPPTVTLSSSSTVLTCTNPTATLTASGGNTYSWTGPSGFTASTAAATVSLSGNYTVVATGTNGCTTSQTILITNNKAAPGVAVSTSSGILTCTNSTATLTATNITGTYSWARSGGGFTATSAVVSVSLAGTYTVTATGTNGCTATASIVINENKTPPTVSVSSNSGILTCTNPSLSVTASGGSPYSWIGPGGFTASVASITIVSAGTYTATGTNLNGCTATASVVVTENKVPPVVSVTPTTAVLTCTAPSTTLAASGGNSYNWTRLGGGFSSSNSTVNTSLSGTYNVTATGTNGCTATGSVVITEDKTSPTVSVMPTTAILTCTNLSTTLTANGGNTYAWTGTGGFTASTAAINVTSAGTYTVRATGLNGCTATTSVAITQNITATATITPITAVLTCANPTIMLTASGGISYSWTGAGGFTASTATATISDPGAYTVTTIGTNGCTATASILVTQNLTIPIAITPTTVVLTCINQTATLTASGGNTYAWTGTGGFTAATPSVNISSAGTYTVAATGTNGCTGTASVIITQNLTTPTVVLSPTSVTLNCNNPVINVTASGGNSYSWTGPGGFTATSASPSISTGGTFIVTATGTNGCTATASINVIDNKVLAVTLGPHNPVLNCNFPTRTITAMGGSSYSWTGPGGFTASTPNINVSIPGTYTVSASDGVSCTGSTSVVIIEDKTPPVATITASSTSLTCTNPSVTLTASAGSTYYWAAPQGYGFTQPSITTTLAGAGQYKLYVTGANGCTGSASVVITNNVTAPAVVISPSSALLTCTNPNTTLTASGGNSFIWSGSGGFTASTPAVTVSVAGFYVVTSLGTNGCTASVSVTVTENKSAPQASIQPANVTLTCLNPTASLTASGGSSYTWAGSNSFTSTASVITISNEGVYNIISTGTNGCTATNSITVNSSKNPPNLSVSVVAPSTLSELTCSRSFVAVEASTSTSQVNFVWSGPNGFGYSGSRPIPAIQAAGTYIVTATQTSSGCTSTASIAITDNRTPPSVSFMPANPTLTCTSPSTIITASGGSSYEWTKSGGGFNASIANPTISTAGTYFVTATGSNGCTASASVVVNENKAPPTITVTPTSAALTCTNPSTTLTASGGGSYAWTGTGGFTANTASITISAAGTYTVTATGTNGCTASASVVITENKTLPILVITNPVSSATVNLTLPSIITGSILPVGTILSYFEDNTASISLPNPTAITVAGTYYIKATVAGTLCTDIKPVIVTISTGNCAENVVLTSLTDDYATGNIVKQAKNVSGTITATNKITGTANVTYRAGKSITLEPGFKVDNGTVFRTEFGGCN